MRRELAKGKRGIVWLDEHKGRTIVVKTKNPRSDAVGRIENEATFTKKLNEHGIGPRFLFYHDGELGREYIDGPRFEEWLVDASAESTTQAISALLEQCQIMDRLGIAKEEMHHPTKHILMSGDKPVMIDFERCHHTTRRHNVTQFLNYLERLRGRLQEKGIHLHNDLPALGRRYLSQGHLNPGDPYRRASAP